MKIIQPEYTNDVTLLSSNVIEDDYLSYDETATYGVGNADGDDGNTVIFVDDNVHWVVRSLVASNTGNTPTGEVSDTNWVKVSETNRWKMFDLKTTSQTVNNNIIDITLAAVNQVDAIALLNIDAANVSIYAEDLNGDEIYSETRSLVSTEGVYDAYTYFFSPIVRETDIVFLDLIPHALSSYKVTLTSDGDEVKCGTCLVGKQIDFGETLFGMELGINDYSIKKADEFGDFVITERSFSKTMDLSARMEKGLTNVVANTLNSLRATPIVYIGDDDYASSFIYGFYKSYKVIVDYPTHSLINIEVEGL